MATKRSIYLKMPMSRADAESRLAELYAQADLITNGIIDPSQNAQSLTISAGGGSKSITFKSEAARQYQLDIVMVAIEDLEDRLAGKSPNGPQIKRLEVYVS